MFFKVKDTMLLIFDYSKFAPITDEVDEWCKKTFDYYPRQGMVLTFANERDLILFLLRWV